MSEQNKDREAFDDLARKLVRVPKKALKKEVQHWKKRREKKRKKK